MFILKFRCFISFSGIQLSQHFRLNINSEYNVSAVRWCLSCIYSYMGQNSDRIRTQIIAMPGEKNCKVVYQKT